MSPEIKFIMLIMIISFFPILYRCYLNWRTNKWHELTGVCWDETYETLKNVLLALKNTELAKHITNGCDAECGHFYIEVDHIKFKISIKKHPIKSWKDYRKYKKENGNILYILKTMPTLNSKSKIIARYETIEDFISDFPNTSSLYVK